MSRPERTLSSASAACSGRLGARRPLALYGAAPCGAEAARIIPPPAVDEPRPARRLSRVAVLAGGCFWGVQGVFQHVKGVTSAVSGYAGGDKKTAHYETVEHAARPGTRNPCRSPSIRARSATDGILQIYFSVAHDPTELNRQGPDFGHPVSLGDLPETRRAGARSPRPTSPSSIRPRVFEPRSSRRSSRTGLLSGRGLPSGLPDAAPRPSLHRHQRPAEDRRPEARLSRPLSRRSGAGRHVRHVELKTAI